MGPLEYAAVPLDVLRGATLRTATRSRTLTRVLGRRDTRIAALGALQVTLLFALAMRWPVAMYFVGPVVLGVLHLAADVRYLAFRLTLPRLLLGASLALALGLTVVRACVGLRVASPILGARVDILVGAAWVGLALVLRLSRQPARLAIALVPFAAALGGMLAFPQMVDLLLTHGHNCAAFVLWFTLFRRQGRTGWAASPLVLVGVATLVLLSGVWIPWTSAHGGLMAFGQKAARLGMGLAPGAGARLSVSVAAAFVFLQSVHYAVWTGWIAQDCLPGEGTPTFRQTVRSLERDFGRVGVIAIVVVTAVFAVAAYGHIRESVAWYMTLARAHVWFELAVFAYTVGRDARAVVPAARPAGRVVSASPVTRRHGERARETTTEALGAAA
jgi:hypothetical protein